MTGSTCAKPPQRTQTEEHGKWTRQGLPYRGAENGYGTERAQRPRRDTGKWEAP